jgi:hypothetical protein
VSGRLQAYGEATSDLTTNTQENFRLSFGRLLQQLYGPQQIKERENERTVEVKNVSGTAFVVAEFRAEENHEENPLYRDSIVGLFLNRATKQAAVSVAASFPPVKDLVKVRTKYFGEMRNGKFWRAFSRLSSWVPD